MPETIKILKCPNCGAAIAVNQNECEYCHSPVIIETLNSLNNVDLKTYINSYNEALKEDKNSFELNNSLAMCYLKLKRYDKAALHFEKVSDTNILNSDYYYYYSIALLEGRKAFLTPLKTIKSIVNLLETAVSICDKPMYHYFLAYIKYDFYKRKFLNIQPDYKEELLLIKGKVSETDISNFYKDINQELIELLEV